MDHCIRKSPGGHTMCKIILSILIPFHLLTAVSLQAQDKSLLMELDRYSGVQMKEIEQQLNPLRDVIDPAHYILGPMDEISVYVWKEPFEVYTSAVNAEGYLVFNEIGLFSAAGMTLSDAEKEIDRLFSSRFTKDVKITSALTSLRPIVVDVLGAVETPGAYILTAQDRLIQAITSAGGFKEYAALDGIHIRRKDGTGEEVEFSRFLRSGCDEVNPFLYEGDRILVPEMEHYVILSGAVLSRENLGISREYDQSITELHRSREIYSEINANEEAVDFLNRFALFSPDADRKRIWIARYAEGRKDFTVIDLELEIRHDGSLTGKCVPLKCADHIMVPFFEPSVYVIGEVNVPGVYPYEPDRMIMEYIVKAGGATQYGKMSTVKMLGKGGEETKAEMYDFPESGAIIIVRPTFNFYVKEYLIPILSVSSFVLSLYLATR
jgi:protein involved in polysaccharide export with SLBB domain